jgi:hypothetical protein
VNTYKFILEIQAAKTGEEVAADLLKRLHKEGDFPYTYSLTAEKIAFQGIKYMQQQKFPDDLKREENWESNVFPKEEGADEN